jgi:hypothetical protein
MKSRQEISKRNKLFLEFCNLACPKYIQTRNRIQISCLASDLFDFNEIKLNKLYSSFKSSLSGQKKIVLDKKKIPDIKNYLPKKESFKYKKDACKFLKQKFSITFPALSNIDGKFYDSVIKNLINNSNIKMIFLEDLLLEDLNFLKFYAERGIPPSCYKDINKINKSYKRLNNLIKTR